MVQEASLTRAGLLEFLEFVGNKGLMHPVTAESYRVASGKVLGILDETEASDLSKIDLEAVFARYRNLASTKLTPRTIQTYESRVRSAIQDYTAYKQNPGSWKAQTRKPRLMSVAVNRPANPDAAKVSESNAAAESAQGSTRRVLDDGDQGVVYPFPLRADVLVRISGLPKDLTTAEARRLAAFLSTLAQDYSSTAA